MATKQQRRERLERKAIIEASGYLLVEQPECEHTPRPNGYLQWHSWAEEKAKTHRQERCPICGLWAIWTPLSAGVSSSEPTKEGQP